MKRLFFLSLAALAAVSAAEAARVTTERAIGYGGEFLDARSSAYHTLRSVEAATDGYYIINYAPQGWAIVSADDKAAPIIGYSTTGSLDAGNLPENMEGALKVYGHEVRAIASDNGLTMCEDWRGPSAGRSRAGSEVEPLIKVNWNQPSPFNKYCPRGEALVGCVAVAMSQAMSVQQYPGRPTGSSTYVSANYGRLTINFDEQRAYNWTDILSGAGAYDEAARLMWHAGMSVRMNYGTDGSGIPSNEVDRISKGLVNNFGYPEATVKYIWRDNYRGDWNQLILNELMAGRAVIYNAIDTQGGYGHSFNVDGYDGNQYFHLNWGWGGTGNGNFLLTNLRDAAMNMNYDAGHVAVIGIGAPDSPLRSLTLSDTRIEENLPAGSIMAALLVNGEAPTASHTVSVHGTWDSRQGKYREVPFTYADGVVRTTRTLSNADSPISVEVTVDDSESGASITQGFSITVVPYMSVEAATTLVYDRATGMFTLNTKHNTSYTITSPSGSTLASGSLTLPQLKFEKSVLQSGVNTLTIKCNDDVKALKITIP